jgi:hypothetical protein
MGNRYTRAARKARELTNKQLATELASIGPMDRDALQSLLPTKKDKEAFIELMSQVESEKDIEDKLGYLRDNLEKAGRMVFKLLEAVF